MPHCRILMTRAHSVLRRLGVRRCSPALIAVHMLSDSRPFTFSVGKELDLNAEMVRDSRQ
jgi:hypothetical protein